MVLRKETHPILSHCEQYPSRNWQRFSKPLKTSTHPIWLEMTRQYERSMDIRLNEYMNNTLGKSMTAANRRFLSDEVLQEWNKKGGKPIPFEEHAHPNSMLNNVDDYREKRDCMRIEKLEIIPEDEEVELKYYSWSPMTCKSMMKVSEEDYEQIEMFKEHLRFKEVEGSSHQRLIEIIFLYEDTAKLKFKKKKNVKDAGLSLELLLMRNEVEEQVSQWQKKSRWRRRWRPRATSPKTSNLKAGMDKIKIALGGSGDSAKKE
ncbi:hypothetical protein ACLMJK_003203 [Lecanora helva]